MPETYTIMVADDDNLSRSVLTQILVNEGLTVVEVNSGEECLVEVAAKSPDLIMLDIVMPGINGLEVCRRLKKDEKTCHIPVFFITSLDSREDILKGFEVGGVDFISKPIDRQIVMARVRAVLTVQGLINEKENLLRVNQVILQKLGDILQDMQLPSKMNIIKDEIAKASDHMFSQLESIKTTVDTALSSLNQVELSFQFTDRLNQQINEINLVVHKLHGLLNKDFSMSGPGDSTNQVGSLSAFTKTNQQQVDDLINSLL